MLIAGSIYCDYEGSINVDSSDFIKNSAEISSTITLKGKATITNSKFINNTASFVAMELLGDAVLDKNTYLNNNYGMFVLKDGKIYDENMKRMDLITFNAPAVKTEYNSGKVFTVTLTHSFTGAPIHDAAIDIYDANTNKVLLGGVTDSNGVATFDIDLKVGTYNVKIYLISNIYHTWRSTLSFAHSYYPDPVSSKIVVTKISTKTKAPKITAKFKKSKNFKITVTHGKSPVKKVKLKIKIGKKTYKATTNGKGIAKFNVKKLKVGKHKVVISSGNANYKISAKSKITIKK